MTSQSLCIDDDLVSSPVYVTDPILYVTDLLMISNWLVSLSVMGKANLVEAK